MDGFARGMDIIPDEIDRETIGAGIKDCYKHMAPMVDTDTYMTWMQQRARDMGCQLIQDRIDGHILVNEEELLKKYDADAIVACPGWERSAWWATSRCSRYGGRWCV